MNKLTYIKDVYTENTGGHCMVDFVVLKSGRVIGITDESLCVYRDFKSYDDQTQESLYEAPTIEFSQIYGSPKHHGTNYNATRDNGCLCGRNFSRPNGLTRHIKSELVKPTITNDLYKKSVLNE